MARRADRFLVIGDRHAFLSRSGLDLSRTMTPLASRSSWTVLAHQLALAAPGNRSSGRRAGRRSRMASRVRPVPSSGTTSNKALRMAAYIAASTDLIKPGWLRFWTSILLFAMVFLLFGEVNAKGRER